MSKSQIVGYTTWSLVFLFEIVRGCGREKYQRHFFIFTCNCTTEKEENPRRWTKLLEVPGYYKTQTDMWDQTLKIFTARDDI